MACPLLRLRSCRRCGAHILTHVVLGPDSIHAHPRQRKKSFLPSQLPSLHRHPLPFGAGGENRSCGYLPFIAPPIGSVTARTATRCFPHRVIRTFPSVLSPFCLRCQRTTYKDDAMSRQSSAHRMRHSCQWRAPTRGGGGEKSNRGANREGDGYGCSNRTPPYMGSPGATHL
jgi:hypothetical protein